MDPVPISPYTINLVLQYIAPPSQLARPVPPNLLSRSLLQRHAFLEISPGDSSSYLTWPSPGRDRAIQLLESLPMPLDELSPDFLVGYAVDPEHAYAHVHVNSTGDDGLRLVFEWDGQESWKYHDSNVMPFPAGTRPSLGDVPAGVAAASDPIPVSEFGEEKRDKGGDGDVDNNDDGDYWNSYGVEDDNDAELPPSNSKDEVDASEDAYWAQYASVQGTADSTIPSPVHKKTRLHTAPVATHPHISYEEGTIPIINADIRSRFRFRDPKAPPSPNTLAHRLSALSPRHPNASPLSSSLPAPDPEEDIPETTDDDTESPSSFLDDETPWGLRHLQKNQKENAVSSTVITDAANSSSHPGTNRDSDDGCRALEDAVRGLFWLWKTRRESNSSPAGNGDISTEELDKTEFLQLVDRAITAKKDNTLM